MEIGRWGGSTGSIVFLLGLFAAIPTSGTSDLKGYFNITALPLVRIEGMKLYMLIMGIHSLIPY